MGVSKHKVFTGRKKDLPVGKQSGTPAKKAKGKKPKPPSNPEKK